MEEGPSSTQQDEEDEDEDGDGDGDDVPQVQVTIVNEADLEGSSKILLILKQLWTLTFYITATKASYDKIHSIHVYSLSPSPIYVLFFLICSFDPRS
jgi:hypothetical protein